MNEQLIHTHTHTHTHILEKMIIKNTERQVESYHPFYIHHLSQQQPHKIGDVNPFLQEERIINYQEYLKF